VRGIFRVSLGLALVCLLAGCGGKPKSQAPRRVSEIRRERGRIVLPPDSENLDRIRVTEVREKSFVLEEIVAAGKVEANPNRISRVLLPVGGRVREVLVKLGDSVTGGQPLLAVESSEATAALAARTQADAQGRQSRSALSKAERDLARLRDLLEHRAVAIKEVQEAENDVVQAQGAVEQAGAALDQASDRLRMLGLDPKSPSRDILVRAPMSGKVLEIAVAPGEYRSDTSAPLMTLVDLRSIWIASAVPESQIRLIVPGEAVQVELSAYPDEIFRARVTRIADTVDPQTRTVKVEAEITNPGGRLRPEMFGRIRHNHGVESSLAAPASAIMETGGRRLVFVEERRGVYREQAVEIGPRQGDAVPVRSGLAAGDRVVADGVMLLRVPEESQ
jgi:membrane fusion protein, heavy metal efflux system